MRIVFIGTVQLSRRILDHLIDLKADITGVVTMKTSSFNSDFADLSDICKNNNIPCLHIEKINDPENLDWIRGRKPDVIFCFGFSQMLKNDLLDIPPKGVIGYHPAKLPQNRGRHPLIWALALGLKQTASTFFMMDEGADSGDIISQVDIDITENDDARSLYDKVTDTALKQVRSFLPDLENDRLSPVKQDNSKANTWRKRSAKDGRIDFRMNVDAVYNLVRALTRPYCGAHIDYRDKEIKIWKIKKTQNKGLQNDEPGKVLNINGNNITVKCCDGAVDIIEHEFETLPNTGEYL